MSTLYPRLPDRTARERFEHIVSQDARHVASTSATSHPGQYFAPTGGIRTTPQRLAEIRDMVRGIADEHGYPDGSLGRKLNRFDTSVAELLHTRMDLVPAEAADRRIWAFLALIVLPDIAVWRFPRPPGDRVLATDITRHIFGRLWWRAELLRDPSEPADPYHLLDTFTERNFDQILARRRSVGGSPELVRALAKEWPRRWNGPNETDVLRDTLKRLMRWGAFQDLFGLPEHLLRPEVASAIAASMAARSPGG